MLLSINHYDYILGAGSVILVYDTEVSIGEWILGRVADDCVKHETDISTQ